jgi:hypothetical protein
LLLTTENEGRTVIHCAAKFNKIEVFQGIFNLINQNLTTSGEKLSLATDNKGRAVFIRRQYSIK